MSVMIMSIMSVYSPCCQSYLHVAILSYPPPDPRTVKTIQQSEGCGLDEAGKDSFTCKVVGRGLVRGWPLLNTAGYDLWAGPL